jgi:DNA-directed RNA polymerase subunit RPC12/RpoP
MGLNEHVFGLRMRKAEKYEPSVRCPECNGPNNFSDEYGNRRCFHCGHRWFTLSPRVKAGKKAK